MCFQMSPQIASPRGCIVDMSHWLHLFVFFHCVSSDVSTNGLPKRMPNYCKCICLTFLHCAFFNVDSKNLDQSRQSHTGCICSAFPHCVFSNVSSNGVHECKVTLVAVVRLFSNVCFHMCPQNAFKSVCIITLSAFV